MFYQEVAAIESARVLPSDFKVYVRGNTVLQYPAKGFEERILPTFNHYKGRDGGYVAIYTHREDKGVYAVHDHIYVVGQVRVQGSYVGRIFVPLGYYLGDDITKDPEILSLCETYFPDLKGEMWIGGDTGGWYGVTMIEEIPFSLIH